MMTDKNKRGANMSKHNLILKTVEYIEENLEKDLNLDTISEKIGYSKFHLNRIFSETVGCTIYKYIQVRRITEAARKLTETDKPILEIALEANYQSQQAFTNAFSQIYYSSPQAYRKAKTFTPKLPRYTMFYASQASISMLGGMAA
jgi:AraC-like DNA-binding protein